MMTALAIAAAASACSDSNPSSPSGTSGGTASVTAPRPSTPAANVTVRFGDQPLSLTVQNAVITQTGGTTYTFEVATDSGFASKVQTKDGVAEGSNGQTTVRLDALAGGRDYYWHARASGGGTTGPFSPTMKFTMGPAITINPPVPIAPLNGATTSTRPALRVSNASRSGPAGTITYVFEVSNSSAFTTILVTAVVNEGINETGFLPTSDLPQGTLFWRATARDAANNVSSAASAVQSFTARNLTAAEAIAVRLGITLWPGVQPPGTTGHATMGNDAALGVGWEPQTLYYAPQNVFFQSPDIEMLRYFDLFDHGFDPEGAIGWLRTNGYQTEGVWYPPPEKAVLGLHYVYLAARGKIVTNAIWDIVLRVE